MTKRGLTILLALLVAGLSALPAWAYDRGRPYHHHHQPRVGVYFGYAWPSPPPFYYYYPPTVVVRPEPQVYIERAVPQAAPHAEAVWYYCRAAGSYYPYVKECPGGWEHVVPTPPPN